MQYEIYSVSANGRKLIQVIEHGTGADAIRAADRLRRYNPNLSLVISQRQRQNEPVRGALARSFD